MNTLGNTQNTMEQPIPVNNSAESGSTDSNCMQLFQEPIHTHSSRKPQKKAAKRPRSKSTKTGHRPRSTKRPKVLKTDKSLKRKRSRSLGVIRIKRRKTAFKVKSKRKSKVLGTPSARSTPKRLLLKGKKKSATQRSRKYSCSSFSPLSRGFLLTSSMESSSTTPMRQSCSPGRTNKKAKKDKQSKKSAKSRRTGSSIESTSTLPMRQSPSPGAKIKRKAVSTPRRRRRSASHQRRWSSSPHQLKHASQKSVPAIWASRLRPRPLKSARFSCYSTTCLSHNIETPYTRRSSTPTGQKKRQKSNRTVRERNSCNVHAVQQSPQTSFENQYAESLDTEAHFVPSILGSMGNLESITLNRTTATTIDDQL